MRPLNLFHPRLIISAFLLLNLIKIVFALFFIQEETLLILTRIIVLIIFFIISFLYIKKKKISAYILFTLILLTGIGLLLPGFGIFIHHDKLIERTLLSAIGIYFCVGSIKYLMGTSGTLLK
jgi:uncharacterized membrane protein YjjP (DUF1212 family)